MSVVGLRIGRYEVGERIGKGGFGVVHLANDGELGREVAIKFLRPEYMTRTQVVQRFLQEARTCAKIGHPGIVTVFECGIVEGTGQRIDGTAYIVMERLRGESLGDRIASRGRMPALAAIGIARQVAAALHVAHDAGIIHRDLKPDNVFLVKDAVVVGGERVKILDFGVAKLMDPDPDENPNTHSQMMLGTPRYMSPEQARAAAKVDHRTDIYALGCLLYELVCGKPPFGGDIGDVLVAHQTQPIVPPRELVPSVPAALDELIVRMLAKDPGARPASMRAVDDALDEVFGSLAPKKRARTAPDEEHVIIKSPSTDEPTFRLRPSDDEPALDASDDDDHTTRRAPPARPRIATHAPRPIPRPLDRSLETTDKVRNKPPWWRWRYAIGASAALLSGLVMYLVLREPRREPPSTPVVATRPADAAVVEPDAAATVAPADTVDTAAEVRRLTTACTTAQFEKRWAALEDCGVALAQLGAKAEGDGFARRAGAEARAEVRLRTLTTALAAGELATAEQELAAIGDDSVYRNPAVTAYNAAKGPVLDKLVAELNAIAAARDCARHATRLKAIEARDGAKLADEARLIARPCARGGGTVTDRTPLPTPLDACDRETIDREEGAGDAALAAGNFGSALTHLERVARCRPETALRAYLAACRAHNFPKAKRWFVATGSRENTAQICLKEGFDPR